MAFGFLGLRFFLTPFDLFWFNYLPLEVIISFFLQLIVVHCIYVAHFNYSFISWRTLGCFHFLDIVNRKAMNMVEQIVYEIYGTYVNLHLLNDCRGGGKIVRARGIEFTVKLCLIEMLRSCPQSLINISTQK